MRNLIRKIRKIILLPIRKMQFGSFGNRTDYTKPMLISGKPYIYIDNYTIIREYARIEAITDYYGKKYKPKLVIGERVTIEQGVHITCTNSVQIGSNCTISSYVYISDTEHTHNEINKNIFDCGIDTKMIKIGEFVFLGTGAKIMPGVSIGNNCVIGANAVVTRDIPDNCMAVGVPARVIKKYNIDKHQWMSV